MEFSLIDLLVIRIKRVVKRQMKALVIIAKFVLSTVDKINNDDVLKPKRPGYVILPYLFSTEYELECTKYFENFC